MPAIQPAALINALINAFQQSGGSAAYVSPSERTHPRKFLISYQDKKFSIWVYIWTLTHGGRTSLPDEYRIQMTSVQSPLQINPEGYTVLLGYYPDLEMFAGFDLQRHRTFTPGSSSVQIDRGTLHDALQKGLSFGIKENKEIAIGIRPDNFINYIFNAEALHKYGADATILNLLEKATEDRIIKDEDIEDLAAERKRVISNINRYSREANFRRKVINAYENRCAVTRAQLRLVEAAHILPVPSGESSDHITNGISLSPTIHRAFDNSLIYLDEDLFMRLNQEKADELKAINLHAGLQQFKSLLDAKIHLPSDPAYWPNRKFIKKANHYRRIPGY